MILLLVRVMMLKCSDAQIVSFSALFKTGCANSKPRPPKQGRQGMARCVPLLAKLNITCRRLALVKLKLSGNQLF